MEKRYRLWAYLIGSGVALFPIHNTYLTRLATDDGGVVQFFIPAFGAFIWIIATLWFVSDNWKVVRERGLGSRWVWMPLLVIVIALGLSGITAKTFGGHIAPLGTGLCLFSLYLASRVLGRRLLAPLTVGAVVASVGVIIVQLLRPGIPTGGLVFEGNFDIATGYISLGIALYAGRYRWLLVGLGGLALLLSGAPEAVFVVGTVGLVILIRRDWSKRLALVIAPIVVILVLGLATGKAQELFSYTVATIRGSPTVHCVLPGHEDAGEVSLSPLALRQLVIQDAAVSLKPLGDGYNLTQFTTRVVHNVPLVLVQQLGYPGILAALAWLWVSIYGLYKTGWKYVWVLVLSLSVFDHFTWTQMAPYWWIVVGVSTSQAVKSDLVFRDER